MVDNPLRDWKVKRDRLVVRRVLQAGLEFNVESIPRIVREMSYRVQRNKHPEDCPCYRSWPCHLGVEDFNCFLCACPLYNTRIRDQEGFIGGCKKKGNGYYFPRTNSEYSGIGEKVWDCSNCIAYHSPKSVEHFIRDNLARYQKLAESVKKELKS